VSRLTSRRNQVLKHLTMASLPVRSTASPCEGEVHEKEAIRLAEPTHHAEGREMPWICAMGHGGQRIFAVPALDLVATRERPSHH
jgi:hypothetical protein